MAFEKMWFTKSSTWLPLIGDHLNLGTSTRVTRCDRQTTSLLPFSHIAQFMVFMDAIAGVVLIGLLGIVSVLL